jgi:hypothetical protein
MDRRLVVQQTRKRCTEDVLHSGTSARRLGGGKLRPLPTADQDSTQGTQRRLAPMRAKLLPPLPSGRAPCGARRYINEPRQFPLRHSQQEDRMSDKSKHDETKNGTVNRRCVLLGGTTLAAATAVNASAPMRVAQAQQPAPASSGRGPIFSLFSATTSAKPTSAHTRLGSWAIARRTSTASRAKA